jgi:hypothetical protein
MTTIRNFERALGRKILWAPRWPTHGDPNAHNGREYIPRLRNYLTDTARYWRVPRNIPGVE